jgi:hypothetical protein
MAFLRSSDAAPVPLAEMVDAFPKHQLAHRPILLSALCITIADSVSASQLLWHGHRIAHRASSLA